MRSSSPLMIDLHNIYIIEERNNTMMTKENEEKKCMNCGSEKIIITGCGYRCLNCGFKLTCSDL